MKKSNRLFPRIVDGRVQRGIVVRLLVYWAFCLFFMVLPLAFARTFAEPETLWTTHLVQVCFDNLPVFATMSLVLPLAIYDVLKFSNRIVGPVFRLRRELEKFQAGEDFEEISIREKDFWMDLSDGFNSLTKRISELETQLADSEKESEKEFERVSN